jgi:hypothetical protein
MILLRRDDAATGVPARQDDTAMVDLSFWQCGLRLRDGVFAFDEGSAAGRTPVGDGNCCEFGMTLGTNPCHTREIN